MKLKNNENRIAFIIVASALLVVSLMWFAFENPSINPKLLKENYTIVQKWEMPKELVEISGIAWISENKIAAVEDEDGIIFIYDLKTSQVERTINFGSAGDYEGIAVMENTAYVLRSDGEIFEINNYLDSNFNVTRHNTIFSGINNMESLTPDIANNRLLIAAKDRDLKDDGKKSIYAFNIGTKKVSKDPFIRFSMEDAIFKKNKEEKKKKSIRPSDICIHPKNDNIYILEGKNPSLLILDNDGKPLQFEHLSKETFPQPEGIIFSPNGDLFIASEGKNGPGTIQQVKLENEK
ncbi:SdiA-regulated domain-containing protein [Aequorivita echinoideorum]|uniref:SdiA-regulated domain-containing protein n=1 Tax=Aequorivita echinoideorum TaxID=1549647 RepID=A0ABS5S587_9FLAO|nr:SdiA-regulated domain-containing protein [Aequorivita echinoideorum]MBT0608366.1 SdiA-regulated domain-containing protein [Aequorivita echinoideorum]